MTQDHASHRVRLDHQRDFRFLVSFGDGRLPSLTTDEPPPLGEGAGPNPELLLATAVGNCLASSLLFCMQKARLATHGLDAQIETRTSRNPAGRLRIEQIRVRLEPAVTPEVEARMRRCVELFETFCLVTESVREGIDVRVEVVPAIDLTASAGPTMALPESAAMPAEPGAPCATPGGERR
jgi:organic hydroperoxide reductase OsmC/OhrA